MRESLRDTIVAPATAPGEAAVAVLRLSGPEARRIGREIAPSAPRASHHLYVASLKGADGGLLDRGMLVEMHAPRSYTGEDVLELHLHGSRAVQQAVLARCVALGARLAQPGEFTLRAFLNGRMSLAQAEAVGDLIAARNEAQRRVAASHLGGELSRRVEALLEPLERLLADWRAALDFPEHATGDGWRTEHASVLDDIVCKIQTTLERTQLDAWRGRRLALCGAPNVGKSSLLNAWAGETRVLVDAAPGTTRDPVEVEIGEGLVRWSVIDTAGMRAAEGLEAAGIALSREQIRRADAALWIVDPAAPVWPPEDFAAARCFVVGGKADLASAERRGVIEAEAERQGLSPIGWVSSKSGEGVTELRQRLSRPVDGRDEAPVVRERQAMALREAAAALGRVTELRSCGGTLDVMAIELEQAVRALGVILGRDVDLAVLERIFAQFCIGK